MIRIEAQGYRLTHARGEVDFWRDDAGDVVLSFPDSGYTHRISGDEAPGALRAIADMLEHLGQVTAKPMSKPERLARDWWSMDDSQQAVFFEELERIAGRNICPQLLGVSEKVDPKGKSLMRLIGEYGKTTR